ncbi:MAG: hypothetical protein Q4B43_09545 [Bacteroidota bacterium]|nr:hypothetical protein [Bacteroidota bacterium]
MRNEFVTLGFIVLVLLSVSFIGLYYHGYESYTETIKGKITGNIYSLKSDSQLRGHFTLGTGRIGQEEYYFFFSKNEKMGGFVKEKIPTRETLLIEKDTIPFIIRNFLVKKKVFTRLFNSDKVVYDTLEYGFFHQPASDVGYKYILTIPVGTITENQVFEPL